MTTNTLSLTDFLLARIAEDEAAARYESQESGSARPPEDSYSSLGGADPGRILAECEAKRRIVERFDNGTGYSELFALLALPYVDHPDFRDRWHP